MAYKVSLDGKTIVDVPVTIPLFTYILQHAKKNSQVIKDTFTVFDLQNGVTKKLLVSSGRNSFHVFAGKDLRMCDLEARYDSFGTLIVE